MTTTLHMSEYKWGKTSYTAEFARNDKGRLLVTLTGPRGAVYGLIEYPKAPGKFYAANIRSLAAFDRTPFYGHVFTIDEDYTIRAQHEGGR